MHPLVRVVLPLQSVLARNVNMSETACCCTVPSGSSVSDILIARVQDRDVLICPRTRPVWIGGNSSGGSETSFDVGGKMWWQSSCRADG
jgi:hypothetical protein